MTAPVEMTYARQAPSTRPANDGGDAADRSKPRVEPKSMAFLYRSVDQGKAGADGEVEVIDQPPETVVSIGVRGPYTEDRMERALRTIDAWMADHKEYAPAGPPRYLGYNSPFNLPSAMYGEVQVPVKAKP